MCLLKNKQLECQTSILQLGESGGEAVVALTLSTLAAVVFLRRKIQAQRLTRANSLCFQGRPTAWSDRGVWVTGGAAGGQAALAAVPGLAQDDGQVAWVST